MTYEEIITATESERITADIEKTLYDILVSTKVGKITIINKPIDRVFCDVEILDDAIAIDEKGIQKLKWIQYHPNGNGIIQTEKYHIALKILKKKTYFINKPKKMIGFFPYRTEAHTGEGAIENTKDAIREIIDDDDSEWWWRKNE